MEDLHHFWATPFYRSRTDPARAEAVTEYVLANEDESRRKPDSPQRAHPGVFESAFDFLDWPGEVSQDLKRLFNEHLAGVVRVANGMDEAALRGLRFHSHCWFHVTRRGGYFPHHNHPLASWSLVYCAHPGDDDAPDFEAGHLVFDDPRGTASMYLDTANRSLRREFSFDAVRIRPAAGDLLIFPSYIHHAVEPYAGTLPRVSVAANFWFATFNRQA